MKYVVFVVLALLVVANINPVDQPRFSALGGLMELPTEGKVLIATLLSTVLAFVLLKVNMGQYTEPLVAVIAPIIVTFVEGWLGTIDPIYDNIILTVIHLIVVSIGALGAYVIYKRSDQPKQIMNGSRG